MTQTLKTKTGHGQATRYTRGCRCRRCKKAWAAYMRAYHSTRRTTARPDVGYYRGKQAGMRVHLTSLGAGIVAAAVSRTGLDFSDVVERLLRSCGPQLLEAAER